MNENLNLVEILKDCPKGTKLYTPLAGEVYFEQIDKNRKYSIIVISKDLYTIFFASNGRYSLDFNGDCLLFPSRENKDWSKFKCPKPKFDPKTLQPFDKVLVRDDESLTWKTDMFSYIDNNKKYPYVCLLSCYRYCIPYNEDTKHLVGTTDEAPEYYRYWED